MNTKISYLYRDADNYKMHNKCVIAGTLTTEQARTIKDSCEMGEYFIPRQVAESRNPLISQTFMEFRFANPEKIRTHGISLVEGQKSRFF